MFELIIIISLAIIFFIFLVRMPEVEKIESRAAKPKVPFLAEGRKLLTDFWQRLQTKKNKKIVTADPKNEIEQLEMKDLYLEAERRLRFNDLEKAEKLYLKLAVLNPKDAVIYAALGKIYLNRENYQDAIASFKAAINRDRKNGFYYYDLGVALFKSERFREAIICLEKSISINNRLAIRHLGLGLCLVKMGENRKAALAFRRAAEIEPNNIKYKQLLKKAEERKFKPTLK